jgi:hypothetical protein
MDGKIAALTMRRSAAKPLRLVRASDEEGVKQADASDKCGDHARDISPSWPHHEEQRVCSPPTGVRAGALIQLQAIARWQAIEAERDEGMEFNRTGGPIPSFALEKSGSWLH